MNLEQEINTLRSACGFTQMNHVVLFRISGEDAFTLLDGLSTRPLFLRENQTSHTLFLHQDGSIFADVFISSGEDGYYLFAEGPTADELTQYFKQIATQQVNIEDLSLTHELWGLNGPYSWEIASALLGPTILGMPYLTMLHSNGVLCFRAGKTGEYGYDLLVPKEQSASLRETLFTLGASLGLQEISLAALDLAALENWHFCIRTLRKTQRVKPITPIEMQLQWRLTYDREVPGMNALREHREKSQFRAVSFCSNQEVSSGQPILLKEEVVGEVLAASWSYSRKEFIGMALLRNAVAHPKLHFQVGGSQLTTQTPPLLHNLSLHVDPHRHSFKTKHLETFPPLVPQ